jgi:hypothetical protein
MGDAAVQKRGEIIVAKTWPSFGILIDFEHFLSELKDVACCM